jgi:glycosyltransferase involved in cell wall biosynthesis
VVPRYGAEVVGGAEMAARNLARRLARRPGWQVEVFTTCALDYLSWQDHYPEGDEELEGVAIHRFRSQAGRSPEFPAYSDHVLFYSSAATPEEAQRWVELQGPVCPELVEAVAASDADLVAFYPYQYYPTVRTIGAVADRAVLHPAAHDDPPLYLPVFREVFSCARALVLHSSEERRLVQSVFPVAAKPQLVLGLGVDPPPASPPGRAGGEVLGLGERPYLCCLGRVDDLKGTSALAEMFAAYKRRRPGPLALALVGPVAVQPLRHPDIVLAGPVSEQDKWAVLQGATALVSPSPYESFSLAIMEAWAAGLPVVVNARCAATREHAERSGAGLWFSGYAELEVVLDRLVEDARLRRALGAAGQAYVRTHYSWEAVVGRYAGFLERLAAGRPAAAGLMPPGGPCR